MDHKSPRRNAGNFSVRDDIAIAQAAYQSGYWGAETLGDALAKVAVATPDRVLLRDGKTALSASCLHKRATSLAATMGQRMEPGSVVSFMLPNWYEAAEIYLAATLAGMVANPILPSLRDLDLQFILADAKSKMVFVPEEFRRYNYADLLRRVCAALSDPPEVVVVRGDAGELTAYASLFGEGAEFVPANVSADDVRMVMYTSGTTGRPKGVLHTHNTIHALLKQIGEHWLVEPGDRFLVPSPISHIGGSIYAFEAPLLLGTTAVLMDKWDPKEAVPLMIVEKITHMAGATPFLQHLLAAARDAGTVLPDLKVFICGGASVPPALIDEANAYFAKARVTRVYGSTEVPVTTVGALEKPGQPEAAQTDGRPGIAEVRLSENDEICARGPQMLAGYIHADDEGAAFTADGFYRTGDQGRITVSGALVVTGRIKDLIIRNGENIAPKQIEDLLLAHASIAEIAIVGLPDPRTGERACAVIVPNGDAAPSVADLAEFLNTTGVAKFQYPEQVELRDTLPKNEAGKVLKHVLRSQLSEA